MPKTNNNVSCGEYQIIGVLNDILEEIKTMEKIKKMRQNKETRQSAIDETAVLVEEAFKKANKK